MKKLAIFGSTGSIGTQALDVVRRSEDRYQIDILCAGSNTALMEEQIREFRPRKAVMGSEEAARELTTAVRDLDVTVEGGMEAVTEAAADSGYDMALMALVGMIGIRPTAAALEAGHELALANKETLVCAGHIIMKLAAERGIRILPVDSEHSAVFQCIGRNRQADIEQILLTASGGPFFGMTYDQLKGVSLSDALNHPNWDMGMKVTIDSASMVNKGLEVIEARWLFDTPVERIKVLVQRESYVHSMVQFTDGSVLAQIAPPDMRIPISYALGYPDHTSLDCRRLDFADLGGISFHEPDRRTFRGLELGFRAGETGGSLPSVFNAANEEAVRLFSQGRIGFTEIYDIIEYCMNEHSLVACPTLDQILEIEADTREKIKGRWN